MAQNTSLINVLANALVVRDSNLGGTSDANVGPGAATVYLVQVDNSANAAQKVYLKLYNAVAPTIGTTAPDKVIPVPGGSTQKIAFPEGIPFTTGLSMACVTAAGTGGVTSPTSPVVVALTITTP